MKRFAPIFILLFAIPIFAQPAQMEQAMKLFHASGLNAFERMFNEQRIADKKAIWETLTKDEQIDARRTNFAWGVGFLDLDAVQVGYLARLAERLPTITKRQAQEFEQEALTIFPEDKGKLLFGSIGPYKPCELMKVNLQPNNCPCSVGSKFNMSCSGECTTASGRCTVTAEGCGFAWLFSCSGYCVQN